MTLISLLVLVIVFGLVFYLVQILPLAPPFKNIALVIVIIIAILVLLGLIGVVPMGNLRLRG